MSNLRQGGIVIKPGWILDWLKADAEDGGDYVYAFNGMTGEDDLEEVVIDGRFDLIELADYLNKNLASKKDNIRLVSLFLQISQVLRG